MLPALDTRQANGVLQGTWSLLGEAVAKAPKP